MKIVSIRNYTGRNIYSHKPVVKMIVDLENLFEIQTSDLPGFNDKLLKLFPGLRTHCCSPGYEGGFVQRLIEGTLISHVTEHLALELQCMMGFDVYFGKTRIVKEPSTYCIIYEFINEKCAKDFGYAAAEIVSALSENNEVDISEIIMQLEAISSESKLGPSTQAIFNEARRRNIPVRRIGEDSLLQLGYGKHMKFIQASLPGSTSNIAIDLAKDKQLCKDLLKEHRIPVPSGSIVDTEDEAISLALEIDYPIVVKPYNGNQGRGVTANVCDEYALRTSYRLANSYSKRVIIEKYIKGNDYRVLVVGDKVAAVAERKPPFIIGNGVNSICELVLQENENQNRGTGHEKPLTKIKLDSVTKDYLYRLGLDIYDVPRAGEIIYLRENGNLSTGGSARDCTTEIHPQNKEIAIKAAKVIGLEVAGIDIVTENISKPLSVLTGAVIEVNAAPGLRMHLYPTEGDSRNVAGDILDHMYTDGIPYSIPIISITGTNGKTTVTRLIRHVLSLTGKTVGMTCSSGTYVGDECFSKGDNSGPSSAKSILYDKNVDIAVLETARGGIIRSGLGYDLADVGIVINVSEDHLGLDGMNSLEDLAFVKSLVVEAIKPDGYAVLNADDSMTEYIAQNVYCNLMLFSQNKNNSLVQKHIGKGLIAVIVENDLIYLYHSRRKLMIMGINEIPITFDGKAICNIENSLAAVAGLWGLGIPAETIRLGLMSFKPDSKANEGRLNLFDMGDFQVLLDYGHNISGYKSVIQFIRTLDSSRLVGVIGMPGDRGNQAIFDVGRLAGEVFSHVYIHEDSDLRGRAPGEVASILYHGAVSGGSDINNIDIILSETDALKSAINNASQGDLIVVFYEKFDQVYEVVKNSMESSITQLSCGNKYPQVQLELAQ